MIIGIKAFSRFEIRHPLSKWRRLRCVSLKNDAHFAFSFFQQGHGYHSSLAVRYTCVAVGVLSADHIGHWAVTTQFTEGVGSSKTSSYIQRLLRNILSDHTLSIFPCIMGRIWKYLGLALAFHFCLTIHFSNPSCPEKQDTHLAYV